MDKKLIESVRKRVDFDTYELDRRSADKDVAALLKTLPKNGADCRVRGALPGMWEPATVVGYMMTSQGLKALVVYTDREEEDGAAFDFVPHKRIMQPHQPKPKRDILDRRSR